MLGRLFSSASSTATSPSGTRPSTATAFDSDEIHTRNLLYPDTSSVSSSFHSSWSLPNSQSSISSTGSCENLDLDACRDVRVLIAQDSYNSEIKAILYDSKPIPVTTGPVPAHDPTSPILGGGSHQRPRRRSAQHTARPSQYATGIVNPEDERRILADCMFGTAPMAYKGPSTKVHLLPTVNEDKITTSPVQSRRGSLRTGVSNTHGSQPPQQQQQASHLAAKERKSVLITRLFSVVMPPSPTTTGPESGRSVPAGSRDRTPTPANSVGSNNGFPFPKMGGPRNVSAADKDQDKDKDKRPKPPKTSMYAVGLVISLPPPTVSCASVAPPVRCCYHQRSDPDYAHRHEFCCPTPPSFDDDYRSGACVVDDFSAGNTANDASMNIITTHWDVITRALSDLQRVAQRRILTHLQLYGVISTAPQNGKTKILTRDRIELRRMALIHDEYIAKAIERLRWRVVSGIKLPRVVVGQGRWGLWMEEAKWANSRYGGRDRNFFFLTLLTAFLGHHVDWLDVLGPESYKRRHHQQVRARGNLEDSAIPTRTVILCSDRIAARRIIYLLSAFLPAKAQNTLEALPPPSRTSSINYMSLSPPTSTAAGSNGLNSAVGSLRKKPKRKPSKLNMVTSEEDDVGGWDIPPVTDSGSSSVAGSVLQVPLAPQPIRKSGSTGTLTTTPSAATIVGPGSPQKCLTRPGSSGSSASLNLMNTLRRTGTANTSMDSNATGWGSVFSFWSNGRSHSSTSDASFHAEDLTAAQKDEEEPVDVELYLADQQSHPQTRFPPFPVPSLVDAPPRFSVEESDASIDVDIPLTLPFGATSPISSPSSSGWLPSLDAVNGSIATPPISHSMPHPHAASDDDSGINVAGWIDDERFHPDFTLQAVKPYIGIDEDIKSSMRSEPTPPPSGITPAEENIPGDDRWVEVSSVLIADTKRLQIKRLRLRRRVKRPATSIASTTTVTPAAYNRHLQPLQTSKNPYYGSGGFEDEEEEEVMDEEVVCDVDDVLATAIERVIGVTGIPEPIDEEGAEGCKDAVLGALESVVGNVVYGKKEQRWGTNVLTEGVKAWVEGVKEAAL